MEWTDSERLMSNMDVVQGCGCVWFFFFQAEDGIRDAQESRGLGDVYKRQRRDRNRRPAARSAAGVVRVPRIERPSEKRSLGEPVSYTHLTLPTIYSV